MKTWISVLVLAGTLTGTAFAGGTGFVDRDADLSASISTAPASACAGESPGAVLLNGAAVPAPHAVGPARGLWSAAAPALVNGAPVPSGAGVTDDSWCAGAYRPDVGTNFGGR
ncbi:MAG TPA: hypothetical protein VGV13_22155 [Methylomirabilota bacterium]|jgi:hypothetical protein|nr:hypothetical protein [Methylomirabilota bacterium]